MILICSKVEGPLTLPVEESVPGSVISHPYEAVGRIKGVICGKPNAYQNNYSSSGSSGYSISPAQ